MVKIPVEFKIKPFFPLSPFLIFFSSLLSHSPLQGDEWHGLSQVNLDGLLYKVVAYWWFYSLSVETLFFIIAYQVNRMKLLCFPFFYFASIMVLVFMHL